MSAIHNILNRVINLSAPVYHNQNTEKVKNMLHNNNFPEHFGTRNISELYRNLNTNNKMIETTEKYYKIPYIPELSQKLKRTPNTDNNELVFHNMKTVWYSHVKDLIEKEQKLGVIY